MVCGAPYCFVENCLFIMDRRGRRPLQNRDDLKGVGSRGVLYIKVFAELFLKSDKSRLRIPVEDAYPYKAIKKD